MISVREAVADDFEIVYPLLSEFDNTRVTKGQWRYLFTERFDGYPGWCGRILLDDDTPVGFMGYTFVKRRIADREHTFCNTNSWIVRPSFRLSSLALLRPAARMPDVTVTALSPTPTVLQMYLKLGFTSLDGTQRIIFPWHGIRSFRRRCETITDLESMTKHLTEAQARILADHRLPHHRHALIRSEDGDCYLMFNRTRKRYRGLPLPFLHAHHVSDPDVFARHAAHVLPALAARFRAVGCLVEERLLGGRRVPYSVRRPGGKYVAAFKSAELGAQNIDNLYTEMTLLNY